MNNLLGGSSQKINVLKRINLSRQEFNKPQRTFLGRSRPELCLCFSCDALSFQLLVQVLYKHCLCHMNGFPSGAPQESGETGHNSSYLSLTIFCGLKWYILFRISGLYSNGSFSETFKVCSHLTLAFAFASTSPSKFNIASMETQTQMHRMGLNPFLTFYIDGDANANVKCEKTFTVLNVFRIN